MTQMLTVFCTGLLFAIGLGVSGMTDANKVLGFLNLAGPWDPSLAFVMVGAIGIHMALYRFIKKRARPVFSDRFHFPGRRTLERRLVLGAAIFGVGWGIGGYCPGPGIVSSASFGTEALVFTGAMLAGMLVNQWLMPHQD